MRHGACTSKKCSDPDLQLRDFKWFHQIVVCTGIESSDLIFGHPQSSEHQNWNWMRLGVLAQSLADREAVEVRHHDIENNHVRMILLRERQALYAVAGGFNVMSKQLKVDLYEFRDGVVIVYY